jgi:hypothetical protein
MGVKARKRMFLWRYGNSEDGELDSIVIHTSDGFSFVGCTFFASFSSSQTHLDCYNSGMHDAASLFRDTFRRHHISYAS